MKMLTKSSLRNLPLAKVAHDTPDPVVWVAFECISSGWSYYVCGYDPKWNAIWGLKNENEAKLGYLLLDELSQLDVRVDFLALEILPCQLSQLINYLRDNEGIDEIKGWSE